MLCKGLQKLLIGISDHLLPRRLLDDNDSRVEHISERLRHNLPFLALLSRDGLIVGHNRIIQAADDNDHEILSHEAWFLQLLSTDHFDSLVNAVDAGSDEPDPDERGAPLEWKAVEEVLSRDQIATSTQKGAIDEGRLRHAVIKGILQVEHAGAVSEDGQDQTDSQEVALFAFDL